MATGLAGIGETSEPGCGISASVLVKASEPGCTFYQANRSPENPDHFLLFEQYRDDAALAAHRETAHFKEIIEGTIVPMLEHRERAMYTPIAG